MGKDLAEYLPKIIEGVVGKILRIIHRLSSPINFGEQAMREGGGEGGGGQVLLCHAIKTETLVTNHFVSSFLVFLKPYIMCTGS